MGLPGHRARRSRKVTGAGANLPPGGISQRRGRARSRPLLQLPPCACKSSGGGKRGRGEGAERFSPASGVCLSVAAGGRGARLGAPPPPPGMPPGPGEPRRAPQRRAVPPGAAGRPRGHSGRSESFCRGKPRLQLRSAPRHTASSPPRRGAPPSSPSPGKPGFPRSLPGRLALVRRRQRPTCCGSEPPAEGPLRHSCPGR
ncbi:salivary acidic proline-rich phosphoprotein 1/2-like [Serinus canaria]|uniref:salivary acidic proline-rich phosphoprotein 1/2-like n=1 Tax=Serinus canaria TaxID=9135 RepID=UPI0021CC51E1|nr:salivary acidic proline-rich phosphoprotein 1/2-like [Serinus canaria]